MKIRAITFFLDPSQNNWSEQLEHAANIAKQLVVAFKSIGMDTQTIRLACPPIPDWLPNTKCEEIVQRVRSLETAAASAGFAYFSTGPASSGSIESIQALQPILDETKAFTACRLDDENGRVSLTAIRSAARVIHAAAGLENGFANLRFAALARVPAGTPFFPAAFGNPHQTAFSIAMQAADVAQHFLQSAKDIQSGLDAMLCEFEKNAETMQAALVTIPSTSKFQFLGFDFSPAPFPDADTSLAAALEAVGVPALGMPGSLGCAALLAAALDQGQWKRIGFNGLMLPVLEDTILARRALEGSLTVRDLLLFSAVCGAGLDTVPLPGDTTTEQIEALLWDVAALAQRLGKPLTARLMPLPGKQAGDAVEFDFEYFAKGGVMRFDVSQLTSGLGKTDWVHIATRVIKG